MNGRSQFDFFWFAETNRRPWAEQVAQGAKSMRLELPSDISLNAALEAARANGMPKGSSRSACFEIQTDQGIWQRKDGGTGRLTEANAIFTSWEELEELDQ